MEDLNQNQLRLCCGTGEFGSVGKVEGILVENRNVGLGASIMWGMCLMEFDGKELKLDHINFEGCFRLSVRLLIFKEEVGC